MYSFLSEHWLDILTTLLGFIYIWLEYKAHIALWLVSIVMPAMDIYLYGSHGLYGDAGMAAYYTVAAIYGYVAWRYGKGVRQEKDLLPITHIRRCSILYAFVAFLSVWGVTYLVLSNYTNSTVPVTDAFTNALSIVGLWALARKYVEQWIIWIVVDVFCCYLYIVKGIPFKAVLYGTYVIIAVFGYRNWLRLMHEKKNVKI